MVCQIWITMEKSPVKYVPQDCNYDGSISGQRTHIAVINPYSQSCLNIEVVLWREGIPNV